MPGNNRFAEAHVASANHQHRRSDCKLNRRHNRTLSALAIGTLPAQDGQRVAAEADEAQADVVEDASNFAK